MRRGRAPVVYALNMLSVPLIAALALAGAEPPLDLGAAPARFMLTDRWYLPRTLDELAPDGTNAVVLVFTTTACPIAGRYVPRIVELELSYRERGVRFAFVDVGADTSMVEVAAWQVERGIGFPVLKDFDAGAVDALGVTRTPEAVVLDADLKLRYRGRIDRQYRLGGARPDRGREDLREAIDDLLAGRDVSQPTTAVDGCRITRPRTVAPPTSVVWASDVVPIVNRHCVECHRPGGEGPFSLLDYDEARANAEMIREVVAQRRMPPWFASEGHGEFVNRRGLTAAERSVVEGWVLAGAPSGDLAVAEEPPELPTDAWEIGEPDLVIRQLGTTDLPADGYVPYQYVILPHVFLRDTWIQAIQILPRNRPTLHHANLAYFKVGDKFKSSQFITGQVPGGDPMDLPDGIAVRIPAGSVLGLQAHYVTTGRAESDKLSVGIRFPRAPVMKRLRHTQVTDTKFVIPPHASAHEVRATRTLKNDSRGVGMFSHMHLRGRDMTFRARTPDGASETLLVVPNYSFDWQMSYRWGGEGKRFPAGTKIDVVAHFDNSAFNPFNPAPDEAVRFGLQTFHEMMYGFFFFLDEEEQLNLSVDPKRGHAVDRSE